MAKVQYQCNSLDKPCPMVEAVSDLDKALDAYRAEVAAVKAVLHKQEEKVDDIEERLRQSEKSAVSTTHTVSSLKNGLSSCHSSYQACTAQIQEMDRRILEMETKFDTFAADINRQLAEIMVLLQDFKKDNKANEIAINNLKTQIQDLSWINVFRDTLLKKIYQLFSLLILFILAAGVLGFVVLKPYISSLFEDKFVTRQEIRSGYPPGAEPQRR